MKYIIEFLVGTKIFFYRLLPGNLQRIVRNKRLRDYLIFVKKNSPYYSQLLKDIDIKDCPLTQIPSIDKKKIMQNFDLLVTDPSINLEDIRTFAKNKTNKNKKFHDKYYIIRTSGTTWKPTIVLYNRKMVAKHSVSAGTRMRINHLPYVSILADPGFTIGALSHHVSGKNSFYHLVDALLPVNIIVEKLNNINPKHIQAFCGTLIMLANEKEEGRLKIQPKSVAVTGETLYPKQREYLKRVFGCTVYTIYGCTELGHVATECKYGHLHYFDDYFEIEPVDKNNRPVADGTESDHILVTNFLSTVTPIVRYELDDRVTIHHEGCPCGSRYPWIELHGRSGLNRLEFMRNGKTIFVPFSNIEYKCFDFANTHSAQIIFHNENHIEVRLRTDYQGTWEEAKKEISNNIYQLLHEFELDDVVVDVNDKLPETDPTTGKVRTILRKTTEQNSSNKRRIPDE